MLASTATPHAPQVIYDATGFCYKNKDPVQPSIVEIMSASSSGYVRDMFKVCVFVCVGAGESVGVGSSCAHSIHEVDVMVCVSAGTHAADGRRNEQRCK